MPNGPLLGKAEDSGGLAPYTVLAYFRSDMAKNVPGGAHAQHPGYYRRRMRSLGGVPSLSRPHPEYTETLDSMIPALQRWAAKHSPER